MIEAADIAKLWRSDFERDVHRLAIIVRQSMPVYRPIDVVHNPDANPDVLSWRLTIVEAEVKTHDEKGAASEAAAKALNDWISVMQFSPADAAEVSLRIRNGDTVRMHGTRLLERPRAESDLPLLVGFGSAVAP